LHYAPPPSSPNSVLSFFFAYIRSPPLDRLFAFCLIVIGLKYGSFLAPPPPRAPKLHLFFHLIPFHAKGASDGAGSGSFSLWKIRPAPGPLFFPLIVGTFFGRFPSFTAPIFPFFPCQGGPPPGRLSFFAQQIYIFSPQVFFFLEIFLTGAPFSPDFYISCHSPPVPPFFPQHVAQRFRPLGWTRGVWPKFPGPKEIRPPFPLLFSGG